MPELEPLGPILGVLFTDGSSDYILRVLSLAGIPTHFDLTKEEAYSDKTRKRAYQKRLAPVLASFSDAQRRRIGENIARELSEGPKSLASAFSKRSVTWAGHFRMKGWFQ